jgi:hypothetical protein
MKFWNKWLRKIHRWLALPFIAVILFFIFARQMPWGTIVQRLQQVMLLIFVVTGGYLYLLPYLSKWQRRRRGRVNQSSTE